MLFLIDHRKYSTTNTFIEKLLFRSSLHNRDTINWQMRESELLFYTDLHWVGAAIPRKEISKAKQSAVTCGKSECSGLQPPKCIKPSHTATKPTYSWKVICISCSAIIQVHACLAFRSKLPHVKRVEMQEGKFPERLSHGSGAPIGSPAQR